MTPLVGRDYSRATIVNQFVIEVLSKAGISFTLNNCGWGHTCHKKVLFQHFATEFYLNDYF